jgi:hypothetical protein
MFVETLPTAIRQQMNSEENEMKERYSTDRKTGFSEAL